MQDLNSLNRNNLLAELAELDRLVDSIHDAEGRLGIEPNDYTDWSLADLRSRLGNLNSALASRTRQALAADAHYEAGVPIVYGEWRQDNQ